MTRPAPMADGTLAALAKRVEAEEPSVLLWSEAIGAALGPPQGKEDIELRARYFGLTMYGAYLDAADILRPEGWTIWIDALDSGTSISATIIKLDGDVLKGKGIASGTHAEARARLAAALRARDAPGDRAPREGTSAPK